ncbi:MAG: hypothetical protein KOO62_10480 [candidate division Zixibacteria bacterium]|nr:hypothetical protein [candidate division Zixibacteria bacterium]
MRCEECGYGISDQPYYQDGLTFCSQQCAETANELNLNGDDYLKDNDELAPEDMLEELGIESLIS